MVEVYICKLPDEKNRRTLEKLLPNVSIDRQNRMNKFVHIDDAYRTLVGELLVGFILCKRYGLKRKELEFSTNFYGKPFLCHYPFFHYNVSHSGEWVVCAVHDKTVGVDIEEVRPFDVQMAKGLFTEEEYRDLLNEKEKRTSVFYDIWTLKESYIKAVGKGLSIPLNSFQVKKHGPYTIMLTDMETEKPITDFVCKQYRIHQQYRLSVCAHDTNLDEFKEAPTLVSFDTICDHVKVSI
ncbi:4'-phosphopantetheinyl transferase superfamily protein [Priestia megaterium]|nr:4'-phosphopantetheinyl transferase superfamily protein [Priestia megaterium]